MSSDATGEIYMIVREDGTPTNGDLPTQVLEGPKVSSTGTGSPSSTRSGSPAGPTAEVPPMLSLGLGMMVLQAVLV